MDTRERPKVTRLEIILNVLVLILYIGSILYLIFVWKSLPSEIPAHYNALGEVTRWTAKWKIIFSPIVTIALWIIITVLEKYIHLLINMSNEAAETDHNEQVLNTRIMLNVIKNFIVIIFVYTIWKDVQIAFGNHHSLGKWFLPAFFMIMFILMGYFLIKHFRNKK